MFLFKKILSQFFMPVPLIICIIFFGLFRLWLTRKQLSGKFLVSLGFALLVLLSYAPVTSYITGYLESEYPPLKVQLSEDIYDGEDADFIQYVVVLGGGHSENPELPVTSQLSETTVVRLIEGIRLYRKYPGSKLVLSGGTAFGENADAVLMAHVARELGVNEDDIIIESDSRDTKDEAQMIKPIVQDNTFLLVTSAVHMYRSVAMFQKMDMHPIPAPVGHTSIDAGVSDLFTFFPSSHNLDKSTRAVHEYLGVVWASLRGQI